MIYAILIFSIILSFVMLTDEVDEDSISIKSGYGDKHIRDVIKYFSFALTASILICMLMLSLAGVIMIPIYAAMRFAFFNRWLNIELGNDKCYLSDRGWDKFYKSLIPNCEVREFIEYSVVVATGVASFFLAQWLDTISFVA